MQGKKEWSTVMQEFCVGILADLKDFPLRTCCNNEHNLSPDIISKPQVISGARLSVLLLLWTGGVEKMRGYIFYSTVLEQYERRHSLIELSTLHL